MGRKKLNVVIDMAGVTVDTHGAKLELLRDLTKLDIKREQFLLSRSVGQLFQGIDGVERQLLLEEYRKMTRKLFENPERVLAIPPIKGAPEGIRRIIAKDHQVTLVTNQKDPSVGFYRLWLDRYDLKSVPLKSSAHADSRSKAEFTAGADVVVDDKIFNLSTLVGTVPAPVLFRGWAEHTLDEIEEFKKTGDVYVVKDWREVLRTVETVEAGGERNPYPSMAHGALAS